MKGEKVRALLKKNSVRVGGVVLAAVVALGSFWALDTRNAAPELVTFVDTEGTIEIEGEEVPLAAPKVTKKVKTKKTKKKIKMKVKSKKTYVKKTKKTKKQTRTVKSSSKSTKTVTVVNTEVSNQYKKNSNINNQVTTTKTTTTTTVTQVKNNTTTVKGSTTTKTTTTSNPAGNYSVAQAAPVVNKTVANAFTKMGFKITVNPNVSYSGLFDARSRTITMRKLDATVYHELGHYLAFIAGNYDITGEFKGIFEREKSRYTASNKAYVLQNSSEYFAESFKNYTLEPAQLKASRPETYSAIETALSKVTDSQINRLMTVYRSVWKA